MFMGPLLNGKAYVLHAYDDGSIPSGPTASNKRGLILWKLDVATL